MVGAKCSRRLTQPPLTSKADGDFSYLLVVSAVSLWVAESGTAETEGILPVDCTLTIKSVLG